MVARRKFSIFSKYHERCRHIFRIAVEENEPPVQLMHFKSGEIFDFSTAPNGKRAVRARGLTSSDIVIFKNSC
jgi:hypothetical protein